MSGTRERGVRAGSCAAWLLAVGGVAGAAGEDLLVSAFTSNNVAAYCGEDGGFIQTLPNDHGLLGGAQGIDIGPDGLIYVCSETANRILRYTPALEYVDSFIFDDPNTPGDETGGMDGPTAGLFGPDGAFYVASFDADSILRYDGVTGAFLGVFVSSGDGGLNGPDAGVVFHPDGDLLVPSFFTNEVLRYDGASGASLGAFVPSGAGLNRPRVILIREDLGDLLVSSSIGNRVQRYALADGAPLGEFVAITQPSGLERDAAGNIYVARLNTNAVRKFDADGNGLGAFVPAGVGGIDVPTFLKFIPARRCEGDTDGDGDIDVDDLGAVLSAFGTCAGEAGFVVQADANRDGCVNIGDLGYVLANFGT